MIMGNILGKQLHSKFMNDLMIQPELLLGGYEWDMGGHLFWIAQPWTVDSSLSRRLRDRDRKIKSWTYIVECVVHVEKSSIVSGW